MKNIFLSGRRCAELAFGLVGFFGFHYFGHAQAATINAASPSLVDVTAAIALASDGDTVIVPAGTASWTSNLIITNGITLMGQTTTDTVAKTANDQTIILDNVDRAPNMGIIDVQAASNKSYQVSGITFRKGALTTMSYAGAIHIQSGSSGSDSHAVRVDHCHFNDLIYQNDNVSVDAALYGVIDHNLFDVSTSGAQPQAIIVRMKDWNVPGGQFGDGSWADYPYYGSEKFVFIEDNCFNNLTFGTGQPTEFGVSIDAQYGGRYVFRYNHCYDMTPGGHGTENGPFRGVRECEYYNNDFHYTHSTNVGGGARSGGFITHDNTYDGSAPTSGPTVGQFRIFASWAPYFGSTGDNVWDVNATESDGTHVDGHPPYLFDSGTAGNGTGTAGETITIVDTSKNWTPNDKWRGYTVKRVSDGCTVVILNSTATALTGYSRAGIFSAWSSGDAYQIHKVLISQDQACRGKGDLIIGDYATPINSTTGTAMWSHQALEPAYSWNNVYNPGSVAVNIHTNNSTGGFAILTEGQDYFNNTPMPGYTPYAYPHPLVSGGPGPQAPGDLHIMP